MKSAVRFMSVAVLACCMCFATGLCLAFAAGGYTAGSYKTINLAENLQIQVLDDDDWSLVADSFKVSGSPRVASETGEAISKDSEVEFVLNVSDVTSTVDFEKCLVRDHGTSSTACDLTTNLDTNAHTLSISFSMPEVTSEYTAFRIKVTTPVISISRTEHGSLVATQNGKQLLNGKPFAAGSDNPIYISYEALDPDYTVTASDLKNNVDGGKNTPRYDESLKMWVIDNPDNTTGISLSAAESRVDGKIEVGCNSGTVWMFVDIRDDAGNLCYFFGEGETIHVDVSNVPSVYAVESVTSFYSDASNKNVSGPTFTKSGSVYVLTVSSSLAAATSALQVQVNVTPNVTDGNNVFFVVESALEELGATCEVYFQDDVQNYAGKEFPKSVLDQKGITVKIRPNATGSILTDDYQISVKALKQYVQGSTGPSPSVTIDLSWNESEGCYMNASPVSLSGFASYNNAIIRLETSYALTGDKHSIVSGGQYTWEASAITYDVVVPSAAHPERVGDAAKNVYFVYPGETVVATCVPPEGKMQVLFKAGYDPGSQGTYQYLDVTPLGGGKYRFTLPETMVETSKLSIVEKSIAFVPHIETCENVSETANTGETLLANANDTLAAVQRGEEIAGVASDDLEVLQQIASMESNGLKNVSSSLTAEAETLSADDETLLKNALAADTTLGNAYDCNVSFQLAGTANGTDTIQEVSLSELSTPVEFKIENANDFDPATVAVYSIHEGKVEAVNATIDSETGDATVSAGKFSTYVMVSKKADPAPDDPSPSPSADPSPSPSASDSGSESSNAVAKTGDTALVMGIVALLAAAGGFAIAARRRNTGK